MLLGYLIFFASPLAVRVQGKPHLIRPSKQSRPHIPSGDVHTKLN